MSNQFGAYYKVDPAHPNILLGKSYENSFPMGEGVSFFLLRKDELTDSPDGTHGLMFDISSSDADSLAEVPIIGRLLMGYPVTDLLPTLMPVVRYLVESDIAEGLSGPEIIYRRVAILIPQFIGFTHEQVKLSPLCKETTDEDGNVIGNISRCSLEEA